VVPTLDAGALIAELAARNALDGAVGRIVLGEDQVLLQCQPLPQGLAQERSSGIRLAAEPFDWAPAEHKLSARAELDAAERRAGGEVARLAPGERLLETTRSNLFVVTPTGLETASPPAVLPGVERARVLARSRESGLRVRRRAPRISEASTWIEAFVTNAVRGVRPVRELARVRLSAPGAITLELQRALDRELQLEVPARD
jgi:branched-subunit amino acid aminotransferase/4-amino-4-deoxychorismate lyase